MDYSPVLYIVAVLCTPIVCLHKREIKFSLVYSLEKEIPSGSGDKRARI